MSQKKQFACKQAALKDAQIMHGSTGQLISQKPGTLILIVATYVIGCGGMLM